MAESTHIRLVLDFICAWEAKDAERVLGFFAPDAIYHNIPMAPLNGTAQIREMLTPFIAGAEEISWTTHHIAETAKGVVLTERTDKFAMANGRDISLPVMGTFEIKNGKIAAWRDYFDLADFQKQMAG